MYIYELTGSRRRSRFTFNPTANGSPVWSPDGRRIAFAGVREAGRSDLFVKGTLTTGGGEELYHRAPEAPGVRPTAWSPDGRYILLWSTIGSEKPQNDVVSFSVADRRARTLIAGAGFASFSPDGRWVAYWTNKSGQGEIYVRPFDPLGAMADPPEWTVSSGARPVQPLWRGDEIFYRARDQQIMSVRVKSGGSASHTLSAGVPEPLFPIENPVQFQPWAVSRDGRRFILPVPASEAQAAAYRVVLNWEGMGER